MIPILDGSTVNIFIAFIAGFVTFFASCLLPLVPTYLAYLSGVSLTEKRSQTEKYLVVKTALVFVLGFVSTFVFLSLFVSQITQVFVSFRIVVEKVSGLFFILIGLFVLGVFKNRLFSQERRINLEKLFGSKNKSYLATVFRKNKYVHAFLTGIAFGFGWTPCIGPVLAVILYWASQGTIWYGMLLLVFFGLGLGLPFVLVALGFEKMIPHLKKYSKISKYVGFISGLFIILIGTLLLLGQFDELSFYLLRVFNLSTGTF